MISKQRKLSVLASSGRSDNPLTYFAEVSAAFEEAGRAVGGIIDRSYTIAGYSIRLRFAGPALLPAITPALAHLEAPLHPAPALTVCLWDSATTGTKLPPFPWHAHDHLPRGEIRGYSNGRIYTSFQSWAGILSMLDTGTDRAIFWVPQAAALPSYEAAMPLRTIFHWWMSHHERQLVHAAAVGTPEGGVLLVGKGGSGKSTTALACLDSGLIYLGDDYVALEMKPAPFAHSLYNSAKLTLDSLERLPQWLPAVTNPDRATDEKAILFVHDRYRHRIRPHFRVCAVLIPRVTAVRATRLVAASPGTGLLALAPSTIFWLPYAGDQALRTMARLVRRVPIYILEVGSDIAQIPTVVSALLAELSRGPELGVGARRPERLESGQEKG